MRRLCASSRKADRAELARRYVWRGRGGSRPGGGRPATPEKGRWQQVARILFDRHVETEIEHYDVAHDPGDQQGSEQGGAPGKEQQATDRLEQSAENGVGPRISHQGPQQGHRRGLAVRLQQAVELGRLELYRQDFCLMPRPKRIKPRATAGNRSASPPAPGGRAGRGSAPTRWR